MGLGVVGPGAVGAARGIGMVGLVGGWRSTGWAAWGVGVLAPCVVVLGVVVEMAEPEAVGAVLGRGWSGGVVGVMRLARASQPSRAARSCAQRRPLLAASRRWTSTCAVTTARLLVVSSGLQRFRERCHEPVPLCERRARLIGRLPDEDLHPRKGASRCGVTGIAQLIHRIAGNLCDGVHA